MLAAFAIATAAVFASHLPFLHLPYYWDEAGHFVPAARDLLKHGEWIPSSTVPNIHPPAVMAYLAAAWKLCGYSPAITRAAMLMLGALGLWATLLLARELVPNDWRVTWLTGLLLFASPLFFTQSMLAQLDLPAMLFSVLALLAFLQRRIVASVCLCVVLAMVKETGLVVPLVLAVVLLGERRPRQAAWFALPALAFLSWVSFLRYRTGHWAGSSEFAIYNLEYLLEPFRLSVSFLRRAYFLAIAGTHWIGTAAILYFWKNCRAFRTRSWRLASMLVIAETGLVIVLGGASLERYLLPVMPLVYAAMAAAIMVLPKVLRAIAATLLVVGLAAANWINPPYPFPYEDNLALVDFVNLQQQAANYLDRSYPNAQIATVWPLSIELTDPALGFVSRPLAVRSLPDLTTPSLKGEERKSAAVFVAFSKTWDPHLSLMHWGPLRDVWQRHYGQLEVSRSRIAGVVRWDRVAQFERRGQWVDIFVNPAAEKR